MTLPDYNELWIWRDSARIFDFCCCLLNNHGKYYGKFVIELTEKIHNILVRRISA